MTPKPIDIIQEFVELYTHEETLAFFEVQISAEGESKVSGLCRISRPKSADARGKYISLTFTFDTPDEKARSTVDAALAKLEGEHLRELLPTIAAVVPLPPLTQNSETYVRQLDLMLEGHIDPGKLFIAGRLLPAVQRVARLTPSAVVWWDEAANAAAASPAEPEAAGLADRLKQYLGKFLRR